MEALICDFFVTFLSQNLGIAMFEVGSDRSTAGGPQSRCDQTLNLVYPQLKRNLDAGTRRGTQRSSMWETQHITGVRWSSSS